MTFYDWFNTYKDLINTGGIICTTLALGLALVQLWQARTHGSELKEIRNSISTKYIGQFPEYLKHITKLIESAEKSLNIVCDKPAFGHFSAMEESAKYIDSIEGKLLDKKVKVQLVFLNEELQNEDRKTQFKNSEMTWPQWKKRIIITLRG